MRLFALFLLVPTLALADAWSVNCSLTADKDDRVAKGKDLEVTAKDKVKDAVVVDGHAFIRKGAKVKSVVALRGDVTVEDGALVKDSVVVVGGKAHIAQGATVKGSRVVLDDGLHVTSEDGDRFDLAMSFDGESLGKKLVDGMLKDIAACKVEQKR